MKMKKLLASVGAATLLLTGALAGCSDSSSEKASSGSGEGDQVTITLSGWGASPEETDLLKETIAVFEKQNPNIKVKQDVIADQYMDVMKTRLIGGEAADVFYLDAFEAPGLIETGVLEPLDEYMDEEFDLGDFEEPLLEAFQKDGATYGLPKGYSTLALFYNKKMLEEAGVEVPQTWDELREAAKKLTKGSEVYGFGAAPELARTYFMAEAYGGDVVVDNKANFASPEAVKGLQPIVDMHNEDKSAAQPNEVGANWGGEMFGQSKAAMVIEGNWAIPFLENTFPDVDYGTAEVPTIDGEKGTMAYTVAYVMNKQSDKKEAAWKLIEFLTGKEGMELWTSKGFELPSRRSVAEKHGFDQDELRGALVKGAPYATVWADGTNLPIVTNNFNNQFVSAFLGERPLDEALQEAQKVANKEIESQN